MQRLAEEQRSLKMGGGERYAVDRGGCFPALYRGSPCLGCRRRPTGIVTEACREEAFRYVRAAAQLQ